jgi:hypothetical protein
LEPLLVPSSLPGSDPSRWSRIRSLPIPIARWIRAVSTSQPCWRRACHQAVQCRYTVSTRVPSTSKITPFVMICQYPRGKKQTGALTVAARWHRGPAGVAPRCGDEGSTPPRTSVTTHRGANGYGRLHIGPIGQPFPAPFVAEMRKPYIFPVGSITWHVVQQVFGGGNMTSS